MGHSSHVWRFRLALVGCLFALLFAANAPRVWSAAAGAAALAAVALYRSRRSFATPARLLILKRSAAVAFFVLLAAGAWGYHLTTAEGIPDISGARSAEIDGVTTEDRDTLDALAAVLAKAERAQDHKCGACGDLVVRRSFGRTVELGYLPGHDDNWYEVQYRGRHYRMPRGEFLAVVRRMGVTVPLKCP